MTATRTVPQKVGDWLQAYAAIREELTPEALRQLTTLTGQADNAIAIQTGMAAAKIVFANDRAAATIAALLTTSGIKQPVSYDEE